MGCVDPPSPAPKLEKEDEGCFREVQVPDGYGGTAALAPGYRVLANRSS